MPDVVTYTALIGAYEKGHQWRQALQVTSACWRRCQALGSQLLASPGCALLIAEAASELHWSGHACLHNLDCNALGQSNPPASDS